jgi:hypothetical protein
MSPKTEDIMKLRECFKGRYMFGDLTCRDKDGLRMMQDNPLTFEQMVTVLEHEPTAMAYFKGKKMITVELMRAFFNWERSFSGHEIYMTNEMADGTQYPTQQEVDQYMNGDPDTYVQLYNLDDDYIIYNIFPMQGTFELWMKIGEEEALARDSVEKAAAGVTGTGKDAKDDDDEME